MNRKELLSKVKIIEDNTFELVNFRALPKSSSLCEQIAAIETDKLWQWEHI